MTFTKTQFGPPFGPNRNRQFWPGPPLTSAKNSQKSIFGRVNALQKSRFFTFTGGGTGKVWDLRANPLFFDPVWEASAMRFSLQMANFGVIFRLRDRFRRFLGSFFGQFGQFYAIFDKSGNFNGPIQFR